jgi:hypothetical protein
MPPAEFETTILASDRPQTHWDRHQLNYSLYRLYKGFQPRSENCGKWQPASSRLSARMEQLGSYWTDFHGI